MQSSPRSGLDGFLARYWAVVCWGAHPLSQKGVELVSNDGSSWFSSGNNLDTILSRNISDSSSDYIMF